jgi:hypothetical protein
MQDIYYIASKKFQKPAIIHAIGAIRLSNPETAETIQPSSLDVKTLQKKLPDDICREVVSMKTTRKFVADYLTFYIENEMKEVVGLVIVEIGANDIEVQILCTKARTRPGNGRLLLNIVKDLAKHLAIPKVKLIPVQVKVAEGEENAAAKFYLREGFVDAGFYFNYEVEPEPTVKKSQWRRTRSRTPTPSKRSRSRSRTHIPSETSRTRSRRSP